MRGIHGIAALAILGAALAGWMAWATLGWAQGQYKLPPESTPTPVAPSTGGQVKQVQGTAPALPDKTLLTLPDKIPAVEKEKITAAHRTTGPQLAEKASHRRVLIMIVAA